MLKRIVDGLSVGLGIMAIIIALIAFMIAQNANKRAELTGQHLDRNLEELENASPGEVLVQALEAKKDADAALASAQKASSAADIILSFIEGGFTILTVLLGLGTLVFGLGIQDVRSRVDSTVKEAQDLLNANEQQVKDLERQMQVQLEEAVHSDEERLKESQRQFSDLEALMRLQLAEAEKADNERLQQSEQQFAALTLKIEDALQRTESKLSSFEELINNAVAEAQEKASNTFQALSLLLLAEQQVRAHNRETAIATLEEALLLDPGNQTTNYLLGYLYAGRKQFAQAIQHLERVMTTNPNFAPALAAMGLAQSRMANQEEQEMKRNQIRALAEFNLTKALESDPGLRDPDNESYFGTLGGLYRRQGRDEAALKAYEEAVKVTPNNSYPVGNLAILYKKLNLEEQSQEMFRRVIKLADSTLDENPNNLWTRFDRAQAYLVIEDKKKSLTDYRYAFNIIDSPGPLETALNGLRALKNAPKPPKDIDEIIEMMQAEIEKFQTPEEG